MNHFASAEEIGLIRASARDFARDEIARNRARAFHDGDGAIDRARWTEFAQLGWIGLMVPEARGGAGLALPALAAIAEELGAAVLPEPLVCAAAFAAGIARRGDGPMAGALQERIATGEVFAAVAWQEGPSDLPGARFATHTTSGDSPAIEGRKRFVAHAASADGFLTAARAEGGVEIHWIERGAMGLDVRIDRTADGGSVGELRYAHTPVCAATRVASAAVGAAALADAFDDAACATSAELLGLTRRMLATTLEYLRTRKQFGQSIGSFQALQHRAVDLYVQQELGAAGLADVLREWGASDPAQRARQASRLKARCSDAALAVARESVQMHGAIGFTHECDVGLMLKRVLVLAARYGTASAHRARIAATRTAATGESA
jgi:alkylation response protein AidB-like acyl-CoA dehydrogenase